MARESIAEQDKLYSLRLTPVRCLTNAQFDDQTTWDVDGGLRRLIEVVPEGITVHQNERLVYANHAALEQYGVKDPKELRGCDVHDFIEPSDQERWAAEVKLLNRENGQCRPIRIKRMRPDGSKLEVEIVAVAIRWKGKHAILSLIRDVTDRLATQEWIRELPSKGTHWLWETDDEHRFSYFSDGPNRVSMCQSHFLGMTRWEVVGVQPGDAIWREHIATLKAGQPFRDFEYWTRLPTGREVCLSVSGTPIFDINGDFSGYRGIASDITERKSTKRKIEHMALHDPLTDLPNRGNFIHALQRAVADAQRDAAKLAVLFLDLDHFKEINDVYGHSVGDKVLIEVAKRLKSCLHDTDLIARLGGDEFVVVANALDTSSISCLSENIISAVAKAYEFDDIEVQTTVSIGVAVYPDDGLDAERILANADLALYTAKEGGRKTWRVFDRHLQQRLRARRALGRELCDALDQQQFELHYQPLIDIANGRVRCFEALVRWNHPKRGQVLPDRFIPVTERNQLIAPLTEWVLEEATSQVGRWLAHHPEDYNIAINVSPSLIKIQGFVDMIDRCLAATACDPEHVTIEITEGALVDEAKVMPVLAALKDRGVTIAADDFGTGYSSMSRLKTLSIDALKIDRSFLKNVTCDANDATIFEALVKVGHGLGKMVVAEGVETTQQLKFLKKIGCDVAQGFFIGRPMAGANVPGWSERWRSSKLS